MIVSGLYMKSYTHGNFRGEAEELINFFFGILLRHFILSKAMEREPVRLGSLFCALKVLGARAFSHCRLVCLTFCRLLGPV